jgi:FlaA1/EpsC-like NDP-sugar epimerase
MNYIKLFILKLYDISYLKKKYIFIFFDFFLSLFSAYLSFYLIYGYPLIPNKEYFLFLTISCSSFFIFFYFLKIYSQPFRFFDIYILYRIILASFINLIFLTIFIYLLKFFAIQLKYGISYSLIAIYTVWLCFFFTFGRVMNVVIYNSFIHLKKKKLAIIGLDDNVNVFLNEMKKEIYDIKFIFNKTFDKSLQKKYTFITDLNKVVKLIDDNLDAVIISEKYLENNSNVKDLIQKSKIDNFKIKILKKNIDFTTIKKKDEAYFFKTLQLQDLINRNISYDENFNNEINVESSILVTGAGGSIGSVLTKELLKSKPKYLICLDSSEENLFKLKNTLEQNLDLSSFNNIKYILSNLNSEKILENLFNNYKIDTVYHAAAYKHVNIVEENKVSSTFNNLCGFINLIEISIKFNVGSFVLISSDKAANPKSFMGLTKKICEQILIYYSQSLLINNKHKYFIVRFGNVFESSGSVIPIFKKQIQKGGPITITSFEATRYFMSIRESVNLILQAKLIAKGSEIFILEMGSPIKIYEIAKKLIFLYSSNNQLKKNIEIKEIGLRNGEKLHEELSEGKIIKTPIKNILIAQEINADKELIIKIIKLLKNLSKENDIEKSIDDIINLFK